MSFQPGDLITLTGNLDGNILEYNGKIIELVQEGDDNTRRWKIEIEVDGRDREITVPQKDLSPQEGSEVGGGRGYKIRKQSKKTIKKSNNKSVKVVHQIYGIFDDGIPLKDIPVFYENVQKTKAFCKKHKYKHKMWNLSQCVNLIKKHYPEYLSLWNAFTVPIQRADFVRYCI